MAMMKMVPTTDTNTQPHPMEIKNIPYKGQYRLIKRGAKWSIMPHKKLTTHKLGFANVKSLGMIILNIDYHTGYHRQPQKVNQQNFLMLLH